MGCYRHLTRDDREEIAVLRAAGRSMRAIAAAVGKPPLYRPLSAGRCAMRSAATLGTACRSLASCFSEHCPQLYPPITLNQTPAAPDNAPTTSGSRKISSSVCL